MAVAKKKKRAGAKTDGVFIECKECGKAKSLVTNFYKSDRPEYEETGYCDVCKDCMKKMMINQNTGMMDREVFETKICYMLNIPFIPSEYNKLLQNPKITPNNFYSEYRKALTLNRDYKNMRFSDSVEFVNDEAGLVHKKDQSYDQVTEYMIDFWGHGFSAEYYLDVQKRYDNFMEYEDLDKMDYKKQSDYKMLCHYERKQLELIQDKNAKPQDLKAMGDVISKLSEDLNIKAIQKKQEENDTSHYIHGLGIKYVEDVKKEPIPPLDMKEVFVNMDKEDIELLIAYFLSPLLDDIHADNPYREMVEEDKKKYTPSQEELDMASYSDNEEVDY